MTNHAIDRAQIETVEKIIRPHIRRTPVLEMDGADVSLEATPITLKLELMQHAGSFKSGGALTNLLMRKYPEVGVVAASGGNHGAAVAFAAMKLGIPAKIFVPRGSSPAKVKRIRDYGADLVLAGDRYADALAASETWIAQSGALSIHAFDQRETLLGQGTTGMEFESQAPNLDSVLVSVGGGGLIGGIAAWYAGRARIIGVEPLTAPTLHDALAAGGPVDAPARGLAMDSLAPRRVGDLMFPIAESFVDPMVLVSDDDIRGAQKIIWKAVRIVAEPGGAAAFAALTSGKYRPQGGERVGVVISGGNTVAVDFSR